MLKFKLIGLGIILKSMLVNTFNSTPPGFEKNKGVYEVTRLGKMQGFLEGSGLEVYRDSVLIIHKDGGGGSYLFLSDNEGRLQDTITLNVANRDWEDITRDDQGNIYIGDFGNNLNKRRNLVIYKYHLTNKNIREIHFTFNDQEDFPPERKQMNYDIEAMCWKAGELHLFTKNRGRKCVRHYVLPDTPGSYDLDPLEQTYLPNMITGADIDDSESLLALSSYGRIFLFHTGADNLFFSRPYRMLNFNRGAQMEAIIFIDNQTFVTLNETGKLFLFRRSERP